MIMLQRQKNVFFVAFSFFFAKATLPKKLAIEIGIVTNSLKYKFQLQIGGQLPSQQQQEVHHHQCH
jgi:hypothetical protein